MIYCVQYKYMENITVEHSTTAGNYNILFLNIVIIKNVRKRLAIHTFEQHYFS